MTAQLFHGVDRALFVSAFVGKLRAAGVAVPLGSSERTASSLEAVGPIGVRDLYWVLKLNLISRRDDAAVFDDVFSAVFDFELNRTVRQRPRLQDPGQTVPQQADDRLMSLPSSDRGGEAEEAMVPWITRPSIQRAEDGGNDAESEQTIPERLPSALEQLSDTPFEMLDDDELARLGWEIEAAGQSWPMRRSRRRRSARRGTPDLRRTLRASLRSGGEALTLHGQQPRRRHRPVVLLVDVSGSMERLVRPYLHVTRALATSGRAEVFAFATDLTRLTSALRCRSAVEAMERANEQVGDRFGGTKLASSLGTLLGHRVWGSMVRGAVVVVISDGWDTDAPAELGRRMERLSRLAHRVVWVNPRVAAPGFEPLVGSMAAALPYCDAFLPGHTLRAMTDVLDALSPGSGEPQRHF